MIYSYSTTPQKVDLVHHGHTDRPCGDQQENLNALLQVYKVHYKKRTAAIDPVLLKSTLLGNQKGLEEPVGWQFVNVILYVASVSSPD